MGTETVGFGRLFYWLYYDFDVYLGKSTATSGFGLAYNVVMIL